jgi:acetyl esterase/lipase
MLRSLLLISLFATTLSAQEPTKADDRPVKVLIVTGGCCHNYGFQTDAMKKAAADRKLNIEWTVFHDGGRGTAAQIALYDKPDWAQKYDVVIHNECFASTTDPQYIRRITAAHKAGVNAVVIHCAMHTYRDAAVDDWREFLGVTSRRHDHQSNYPVKVEKTNHPIMKGFPADYKSAKDELYIIEKVWPNTKVLATSPSERDGKLHPVFWTNQYGKGRVFGTTYGHSDETFRDKVFLDTLMRGVQWAAGRLPANAKQQAAQPRGNQKQVGAVRVLKDLSYADNKNPRQVLDLALPVVKSEKPLPVIAFIHGGAWRAGNKNGGLKRVAAFVDSGRYAGVSIGYRLTNEAKWPAQIHDCKAAIRWIKGNAQKYNLDPGRIAVYGTSAGGHLVAMLGVSGGVKELEGSLGIHTDQSSRVTAVANYFGPSQLLTMNDFPGKMDHNAADSPESLLIGGAIQQHKDKANAASPMQYVTADDAPMLLVHGDADPLVPFNQSEILDAALGKAGVSATLVRVAGGGHGNFRNPAISAQLSAFFSKHLLGHSDSKLQDRTLANRVAN